MVNERFLDGRVTQKGRCRMIVKSTDRGFKYVDKNGVKLFQESSAIGEYEDSYERPGSSFLWFGDLHLDREEVQVLINLLEGWLNGKLVDG